MAFNSKENGDSATLLISLHNFFYLERVPKSGARSDYSWRMIDFRLSMVDNRWSMMDFQLTATRSEIDNRPSEINNPSLNRILGQALLNLILNLPRLARRQSKEIK